MHTKYIAYQYNVSNSSPEQVLEVSSGGKTGRVKSTYKGVQLLFKYAFIGFLVLSSSYLQLCCLPSLVSSSVPFLTPHSLSANNLGNGDISND